jgi:cbb3-type cytochrome oxidase maturation protein
MIALYLVLPLALVIASIAVGAFVWTVRSGQLDDLDTPARRILFDEARTPREICAPADEHAGAARGS